jgi:hypothetical protein
MTEIKSSAHLNQR